MSALDARLISLGTRGGAGARRLLVRDYAKDRVSAMYESEINQGNQDSLLHTGDKQLSDWSIVGWWLLDDATATPVKEQRPRTAVW